MLASYLDAIRTFEGFAPQAQWDYAQFTNGYGTRALYAGEVIDKVEADRRFRAEIAEARSVVERHAAHLDEGTKAALTSLTFNAGGAWVQNGLGDAVRRGDLDEVKTIFQQYNKAGGEVLPGLVSRRAAEAMWIGNAEFGGASTATDGVVVASAPSAEAEAAVMAALATDNATRSVRVPVTGARVALTELVSQTAAPQEVQQAAAQVLASSELSEAARLMRLEHGFELLAHRTDREKERDVREA